MPCASCGAAPRGGLQECASCRAVVYCGPGCQQAHWKKHRKPCKAAANAHFKAMLSAAEAGDVGAQAAVGTAYQHGLGVLKSASDAASWFRRAAEAGSAQAQVNLGNFYVKGHGVPLDLELAAMWYRKAADAGHAEAKHNLGNLSVRYTFESSGAPRPDGTRTVSCVLILVLVVLQLYAFWRL